MHMGGLATVGKYKPKNLTHIVFNNNCHESVGGQITCNSEVVLANIAKLCGYTENITIKGDENLLDNISLINEQLTFIEILVGIKNDKNLIRPDIDNITIKNNFIQKI